MCFISSIDFHEFVQCFIDPFPHVLKRNEFTTDLGNLVESKLLLLKILCSISSESKGLARCFFEPFVLILLMAQVCLLPLAQLPNL